MIDLYVDPGHATVTPDGSQAHPYKTVQAAYAIDAGAYIDVEGTRTLTDDTTVHCYRTGGASQSFIGATANEPVDLGGYSFTVINESTEPYYLVTWDSGGTSRNIWNSPAVTRWVGVHFEDTDIRDTSSLRSITMAVNFGRWSGLTVTHDSCRFSGGGIEAMIYMNEDFTAVFNNCVFEGRWLYDSETWTGGAGGMIYVRRGTVQLNNCTFVNVTSYGIDSHSAATVLLRNSYIGTGGNGVCCATLPGTFTVTTSAISDASSAVSGITQNVSQASCNFESLTLGAADIRTTTGSALHDAGTNIGPTGTEVVTYTDDHFGTERDSLWDIGAFEFAVVDTVPMPQYIYGA